MIKRLQTCVFLGLLILISPAWLAGQTHALVLLGYGGVLAPTADVAEGGVRLNTTSAVGVGIALQLTRNMAFRGNTTFSKSDVNEATLQDRGVKRRFVGGDVQIGFPNTSAVVPYFLFGIGLASLDPDQSGAQTVRKLATRLGTGVNYIPDNSLVTAFAELSGWLYRFDALGFDRYQFDLLLAAGLAYPIPF